MEIEYTNRLKTRLRSGETLFGIFLEEFRTNYFSVFLDNAGYDFCIFDMEHCTYTMSELSNMIPCFMKSRCAPIVRVPSIRKEYFQIPMDLGAAGIMVPNVETARQAQECVQWMSYAPRGKRGIATCRPHTDFINVDFMELCPQANNEKLLAVQIESRTGMENLDEILAVDGIDVVFIGNADLSISLNVPNTLVQGSELRTAQERILKTAAARGITGGGNLTDPKIIAELAPFGMRFITLCSDVEMFAAVLSGSINAVKNKLAES